MKVVPTPRIRYYRVRTSYRAWLWAPRRLEPLERGMAAVAGLLFLVIFNTVRAESGDWHLRFLRHDHNLIALNIALALPLLLVILALLARRSLGRNWALAAGVPMAVYGLLMLVAQASTPGGTYYDPFQLYRTLPLDSGVVRPGVGSAVRRRHISLEQSLPVLPGLQVCRPMHDDGVNDPGYPSGLLHAVDRGIPYALPWTPTAPAEPTIHTDPYNEGNYSSGINPDGAGGNMLWNNEGNLYLGPPRSGG